MVREYPRYVGKVPGHRVMKDDLCDACSIPATCWVEVQWSWSRSDDEYYKVCEAHRKLFRENTRKLSMAIEDKRRAAMGKQKEAL